MARKTGFKLRRKLWRKQAAQQQQWFEKNRHKLRRRANKYGHSPKEN